MQTLCEIGAPRVVSKEVQNSAKNAPVHGEKINGVPVLEISPDFFSASLTTQDPTLGTQQMLKTCIA